MEKTGDIVIVNPKDCHTNTIGNEAKIKERSDVEDKAIRSACRCELSNTIITLGEDNVMDIIRVADIIHDEKMFRAGIDFILQNLQKFTQTEKWQNFMDDNTDCLKKVMKALLFKPTFYLDRAIIKEQS